MTERDKIIDYLLYMRAEKFAITKENERNELYIKIADSVINDLISELKMLDLIIFCNTGKYPC